MPIFNLTYKHGAAMGPSISDAALPSIAKKARLQAFNEDQQDSTAESGGGDATIQIPDPDDSSAGSILLLFARCNSRAWRPHPPISSFRS
jgi:hypothetical protein